MMKRLILAALLLLPSFALADSATPRLHFDDDGAKTCPASDWSIYREAGVIKQCVDSVETTLGSGGATPGGSSGDIQTNDGAGGLGAYAGTTPCDAGDFISALSGAGTATCDTPAGGGDITAVWGCTTGDCSALTAAAGDTVDASGAYSTAACKVGTSPPATCAVGDCFFDSNATAGSNLYGCTATNTWTAQGGGSGGGPLSVVSITSVDSPYTITTCLPASSSGLLLLADPTGGAIIVNLPAASGETGKSCHIKKAVGSGGNAVTVDGDASETIDGALTFPIVGVWQSYSFASDGTNWMVY